MKSASTPRSKIPPLKCPALLDQRKDQKSEPRDYDDQSEQVYKPWKAVIEHKPPQSHANDGAYRESVTLERGQVWADGALHNDASLHASSVWALEKQHGHCSDYHGFCSAMGRLLDVPTRVDIKSLERC